MTTTISALTPIVGACAAMSWLLILSRGFNAYWPIALLLTWWVPANIARFAIQTKMLIPARLAIGPDAPYSGAALWAFYVETAFRLTWPFAVLAACVAVFMRRRAWFALAGWVVCTALLCFFYPELRRDGQRYVEAAISSACWVGSAWSVRRGHRGMRIDPPACYISTALILGAQLAVIIIVQWVGDEDWSIAQAIQGAAFVLLLGYQAAKLWNPGATK